MRSTAFRASLAASHDEACIPALPMSPTIQRVTYSRGSGPPIQAITSHTVSKIAPKLTSGSSAPPELGADGTAEATSEKPPAPPPSVIAAPLPNSWATRESVSR